MKKRINIKVFTLLFAFLLSTALLTSCYVKIPGLVSTSSNVQTDDIYIYFTGDTHGADDEGVGYAGVKSLVDYTKNRNNYVTLVDTGDAINGDHLANESEGEYIIELMNEVGYDYAVLGNHEFDYGMEQLNALMELSEAKYLGANISYTGDGENMLDGILPYAIETYGSVKVGFVGVTTPETITSSTPTSFMEDGNIVYDFCASEDGAKFYSAVQAQIDKCKIEGAKYVVLLTHLGDGEEYGLYSSKSLIANISGASAVLDGHAHSEIPSELIKDKTGAFVPLASTGTKLNNIGRLVITPAGGINITILNGEAIGKDTAISDKIESANGENNEMLSQVVAHSTFPLSISLEDGERIVRNRESAIGNLCADAFRISTGANIGFINGGGIRASLPEGNITYGDIEAMLPYGNKICVVLATGAEIADALEFSVRLSELDAEGNPIGENGGFLSVSGLKFSVNTSVESSVTTDNGGLFIAVEGDRRVTDIMVLNNENEYVPLDLDATYTVASIDYTLKDCGDGYTMFADNEYETVEEKTDIETIIAYLQSFENSTVPEQYASTEGRIIIE